MKTPNLIDVSKDSPSKADKLEAFKKEHGIWTHRATIAKQDYPWSALLLPTNPHYELPYQEFVKDLEPVEIIAGYCRILDEAGFLVTGKTESEAIDRLCVNIGITQPL